jgi:hypothetical protein
MLANSSKKVNLLIFFNQSVTYLKGRCFTFCGFVATTSGVIAKD